VFAAMSPAFQLSALIVGLGAAPPQAIQLPAAEGATTVNVTTAADGPGVSAAEK